MDGMMLVSRERNSFTQVDVAKVSRGSFHTVGTGWLRPVSAHIQALGLSVAVDPFAGDGDLGRALKEAGLVSSFIGYDIRPDLGWATNDSLADIPAHDALVVTNPPFLAKHSARRKGLWNVVGSIFERTGRYDLYEVALDRIREKYQHAVVILPETFVSSNYPKDHCKAIHIVSEPIFDDTDCPVVVAVFDFRTKQKTRLFRDGSEVGGLEQLQSTLLGGKRSRTIRFNDVGGQLGLVAVDGHEPNNRIRFLAAGQMTYSKSNIKVSSRLLTYIRIVGLSDEMVAAVVVKANEILNEARANDWDLVWSPFKGNNKAGVRRRRLDYDRARNILMQALGD